MIYLLKIFLQIEIHDTSKRITKAVEWDQNEEYTLK